MARRFTLGIVTSKSAINGIDRLMCRGWRSGALGPRMSAFTSAEDGTFTTCSRRVHSRVTGTSARRPRMVRDAHDRAGGGPDRRGTGDPTLRALGAGWRAHAVVVGPRAGSAGGARAP